MLIGKQVQKPIAYVLGNGDGRMADPTASLHKVIYWAADAAMSKHRETVMDCYLDCAAMIRVWDASASV